MTFIHLPVVPYVDHGTKRQLWAWVLATACHKELNNGSGRIGKKQFLAWLKDNHCKDAYTIWTLLQNGGFARINMAGTHADIFGWLRVTTELAKRNMSRRTEHGRPTDSFVVFTFKLWVVSPCWFKKLDRFYTQALAAYPQPKKPQNWRQRLRNPLPELILGRTRETIAEQAGVCRATVSAHTKGQSKVKHVVDVPGPFNRQEKNAAYQAAFLEGVTIWFLRNGHGRVLLPYSYVPPAHITRRIVLKNVTGGIRVKVRRAAFHIYWHIEDGTNACQQHNVNRKILRIFGKAK